MFGFLKKKLSEDERLEVETMVSVHFDNLVPHKSTSLIDLALNSIIDLAETLNGIPEGEKVQVRTLNHYKLTLEKKDGKFKASK